MVGSIASSSSAEIAVQAVRRSNADSSRRTWKMGGGALSEYKGAEATRRRAAAVCAAGSSDKSKPTITSSGDSSVSISTEINVPIKCSCLWFT